MPEQSFGLGIIVPSSNTVLERDYTGLGLDGVSFHFSRVLNSEDTIEQLTAMKESSREAARLLSHPRRMKGIALGCTGGSFVEGAGYDESVAKVMEEASGLPAVTTSGAVLSSLRALGVRKTAVFTPYDEWLSNRLVKFLQGNGFDIAMHAFGFDLRTTLEDNCWEPINDWVAPQVPNDADGVFISCTDFGWLRGVAPLEERIGRPVLTSNLATLWHLLQTVNAADRLPANLSRLTEVSKSRLSNVG